MRKVITMEQALAGKPVADPLTVYDCSLVSDGAAAVLVVPLERAAEFTSKPVQVLGISQTSDYLALDRKPDITTLAAVRSSAEKAYRMAGVEAKDIQFAEVHDCFTIAELLVVEAMGLAPAGQGAKPILAGLTQKDGKLPINVSGGLKAKGHPIGATGVSMHAIAAMQLTGTAGAMQLPKADRGLVFNMGGAAVANYVSILEPLK
jgi:acetyl-CoA C-acetyltransferase